MSLQYPSTGMYKERHESQASSARGKLTAKDAREYNATKYPSSIEKKRSKKNKNMESIIASY